MDIRPIEEAARGLDDHDWDEFAERVGEIPGLAGLGAYEALHAEAADWNSPPVSAWPRHTVDDLQVIRDRGVDPDDIEACRALWHELYDEPYPDDPDDPDDDYPGEGD